MYAQQYDQAIVGYLRVLELSPGLERYAKSCSASPDLVRRVGIPPG